MAAHTSNYSVHVVTSAIFITVNGATDIFLCNITQCAKPEPKDQYQFSVYQILISSCVFIHELLTGIGFALNTVSLHVVR